MRIGRLLRGLVVPILLASLTACSPPAEEPGLFGRQRGLPTPAATTTPTGADTLPDLPVAADGTWVSNDGRSVVIRYAVHAVRRTARATVLDWSITPLSAAGIADRGAPVPAGTDLALTGPDGTLDIFLVDADHRRVYRPLTRVGAPSRCYCSSADAADLDLRIGTTRLLQVGYPALPAGVRSVDVELATIPPFWHVPVSAAGTLPRPTSPTDLGRIVDIHPALASTVTFDQGAGTQQFIAFVEDVIVADTFTALRWTIQSITDGRGLLGRPPVSRPRSRARPDARPDARPPDAGSTDGPTLLVAGRRFGARYATPSAGTTRAARCLCSDLAAVTGEQAINQRRTVVTTFPALPHGTESVDVAWPGLRRVDDVRVVPTADASVATAPGTATAPSADRRPPAVHGWPVDRWPLPAPADPATGRWQRSVDRLR